MLLRDQGARRSALPCPGKAIRILHSPPPKSASNNPCSISRAALHRAASPITLRAHLLKVLVLKTLFTLEILSAYSTLCNSTCRPGVAHDAAEREHVDWAVPGNRQDAGVVCHGDVFTLPFDGEVGLLQSANCAEVVDAGQLGQDQTATSISRTSSPRS